MSLNKKKRHRKLRKSCNFGTFEAGPGNPGKGKKGEGWEAGQLPFQSGDPSRRPSLHPSLQGCHAGSHPKPRTTHPKSLKMNGEGKFPHNPPSPQGQQRAPKKASRESSAPQESPSLASLTRPAESPRIQDNVFELFGWLLYSILFINGWD